MYSNGQPDLQPYGGQFYPQYIDPNMPYYPPPRIQPGLPGFYSKGVFYPTPKPSTMLSMPSTSPISPKVETTPPTEARNSSADQSGTSSGGFNAPAQSQTGASSGAERGLYPMVQGGWPPYGFYPYNVPLIPPYLPYPYNQAQQYPNRLFRKYNQQDQQSTQPQDAQTYTTHQGQVLHQATTQPHHPTIRQQTRNVTQRPQPPTQEIGKAPETAADLSNQIEKISISHTTGSAAEEEPLPTGDANFPSLAESKNKHTKLRSKRPEPHQAPQQTTQGHGKNVKHSGPKPLTLRSFLPKVSTPEVPSKELWVGNIGDNISEDDIKALFREFCENVAVTIKSDKFCAFVTLDSVEQAQKAKAKFHELNFHEHVLSVHFRKPRQPPTSSTGYGAPTAFYTRAPLVPNPPSRAVWVGDLATTSEDEIRSLAEHFGTIVSLKCLPKNKCCFINYQTEKEASDAVQGLQGKTLGGAPFKVNFGKPYHDQYAMYPREYYYPQDREYLTQGVAPVPLPESCVAQPDSMCTPPTDPNTNTTTSS
ncbi:hypothetical protein Pelo_10014 [Pelomyxa schiedti]|nr:hypothetical protein Pelo_10014 [Pelomyxa schiedti]